MAEPSKNDVQNHFDRKLIERWGARSDSLDRVRDFQDMDRLRYTLEPWILKWAKFQNCKGLRVLEIGIGNGSDFEKLVLNAAYTVGIDIAPAGVKLTRERMELKGYKQWSVLQCDAEMLPFQNSSFDLVYSYGVIHHSPNTTQCVNEIHRILRPGGRCQVMVYGYPSVAAFLVWLRHGLLGRRPQLSPRKLVARHLESPGTKCYRPTEFHKIMDKAGFHSIGIERQLSKTDLLQGGLNERYGSLLDKIAYLIYPRWLIRLFGKRLGLILLVEATKPTIGQPIRG